MSEAITRKGMSLAGEEAKRARKDKALASAKKTGSGSLLSAETKIEEDGEEGEAK